MFQFSEESSYTKFITSQFQNSYLYKNVFPSLNHVMYQSCVSSLVSCPMALQKLFFWLDALLGTYDNGSGRIKYLNTTKKDHSHSSRCNTHTKKIQMNRIFYSKFCKCTLNMLEYSSLWTN